MRPLAPRDRPTFERLLIETWGSTRMATRGRLLEVSRLPGLVAELDGGWAGHLAYDVRDGAAEIALPESRLPGRGVASALVAHLAGLAADAGWSRLWLITTNDNTEALRWYQRRGFQLVALHRGATAEARRTLKPEIPAIGAHGIPIRDELELELPTERWRGRTGAGAVAGGGSTAGPFRRS